MVPRLYEMPEGIGWLTSGYAMLPYVLAFKQICKCFDSAWTMLEADAKEPSTISMVRMLSGRMDRQ